MPEFTEFIRKPFKIKAVQITEENIEDLCELIGLEVKTKDDGTPYIKVNRKVVPYTHQASPGWWVTEMGDQLRCYPDRVFTRQFTEHNEAWEESGWLEEEKPQHNKPESKPEIKSEPEEIDISETETEGDGPNIGDVAALTEETLASTGTPSNNIHEAGVDEDLPSNEDEDAADEALAAIADAQAEARDRTPDPNQPGVGG